MRRAIICASGLLLLTLFTVLLSGRSPATKAVFTTYNEAWPVLEALAETLPTDLRTDSSAKLAGLWPPWVEKHDAEIRSRLVRGEEDSLVNFLLFGTSFTRQPRATPKDLERMASQKRAAREKVSEEMEELLGEVIRERVDDLISALTNPRGNERLLVARQRLEHEGHRLDTLAGRKQVKRYVLSILTRVLHEQQGYAKALEAVHQLSDSTEQFVERSTLYHERGLSVDTSFRPNLAIERALRTLKDRGLLAARNINRVAVIGPGLDFTDKDAGYDFYPLQTIQPFALIDSLLRLGLTRPDAVELTSFDISSPVNQHLARARERARRGMGYVIQLPIDPQVRWKPEMLHYWGHFGDRIGVPVRPVAVPPSLAGLKLRAVRIRPGVVVRVAPVDLDIVLQRLELPAAEQFDLIVATNMFVYYDKFEQSLALANVQAMLRPGGFLLSNNALLELPSSRIRSIGYNTIVYSERPDDGDHVVWYQSQPE